MTKSLTIARWLSLLSAAQGSLGWSSFDNLPSLLEVDLSSNHLVGRLPAFYGTNSVQKLDLSQNALSGNCSAWFMPNLTYLSLGSNLLSEPLEHFPRRFQSLLFLDLSGNYLTVPDSFDDVGGFLFSILPLSVQTVHLEVCAQRNTHVASGRRQAHRCRTAQMQS